MQLSKYKFDYSLDCGAKIYHKGIRDAVIEKVEYDTKGNIVSITVFSKVRNQSYIQKYEDFGRYLFFDESHMNRNFDSPEVYFEYCERNLGRKSRKSANRTVNHVSTKKKSNDSVFIEEQNHLDEVEYKIDVKICDCVNDIKKRNNDLKDYIVYSPSDLDQKLCLIQYYNDSKDERDFFVGSKDSPYFARMDLESKRVGTESIYIGKAGIKIGDSILVFDWRSPVGQHYYMKNQRNFEANGISYELTLRRALEIEKATLLSYNTEFDVTNKVTLKGDIVDPFLVTVLQSKRNVKKLTDIIRTIQENQNSIINLPKDESFILQGCAGSGKTMILLHRLSYLIYNNPNMDLNTIKIITPNRFFDLHINDLSKELGIDNIKRVTVEEFYVELIKRFTTNLKVTSDVFSESNIHYDLLRTVYSSEFVEDIKTDYDNYYNDTIEELVNNEFFSISNKYGKQIVLPEKCSNSCYELLQDAYSTCKRIKESREREYKQKENSVEILRERLEEQKEKCKGFSIEQAAEVVLQNLKELESQITINVAQQQALQSELLKKREEILVKNNVLQRIEKNKAIYNAIVNNSSAFCQSKYCEENNDEITNIIKHVFFDMLLELSNLKSQYNSTIAINIIRRNRLLREIEEKENEYSLKVEKYLSDYAVALKSEIDGAYSRIPELSSLEKEIVVNENAVRNCIDSINAIKSYIAYFSGDGYKNVDNLEFIELAPDFCRKAMNPYYTAAISWRHVLNAEATLNQGIKELENMAKTLLSKEEEGFLKNSESIISKLRFTTICSEIVRKRLVRLFENFDLEYDKGNYRFKLYLYLLLCNLYFDKPIFTEQFLNIDEAQDISVVEYRLMSEILGKKCIFNLYGDTKQLVYSHKGINNWNEIKFIATNMYQLNENYRNTQQITTYCNKEFRTKIYPIGVDGVDVIDCDLSEAIVEIEKLKQSNPNNRVAIICDCRNEELVQAISSLIKTSNVTWNSVSDASISIITPEMAKGLEFDAVVAVTQDFTDNERYIAYTRALDNLFVV